MAPPATPGARLTGERAAVLVLVGLLAPGPVIVLRGQERLDRTARHHRRPRLGHLRVVAPEPAGDCDDSDAIVGPGAAEHCDGSVDAGAVDASTRYQDADGGGYDAERYGGTDRDDTDPDAWPGAPGWSGVCEPVGPDTGGPDTGGPDTDTHGDSGLVPERFAGGGGCRCSAGAGRGAGWLRLRLLGLTGLRRRPGVRAPRPPESGPEVSISAGEWP